MPWPNSCSIVSIQRSFGSTLQSTRTSPSRSMSMQKACWLFPSRAYRSLCSSTGADVEAEPLVGAERERDEVAVREDRIEVDGTARRGVLEERLVEVPRPQLVDRAAEPRRKGRIEVRLPRRERSSRGAVDLVRGREQAILVHLAGREREREVIAVPERSRGLVAQTRELAHAIGDLGADLLRGRPRHAARRPTSSLPRRISRIALSSTRSPSSSPRKVLKVVSTAVSSSTSRRRRSSGT